MSDSVICCSHKQKHENTFWEKKQKWAHIQSTKGHWKKKNPLQYAQRLTTTTFILFQMLVLLLKTSALSSDRTQCNIEHPTERQLVHLGWQNLCQEKWLQGQISFRLWQTVCCYCAKNSYWLAWSPLTTPGMKDEWNGTLTPCDGT